MFYDLEQLWGDAPRWVWDEQAGSLVPRAQLTFWFCAFFGYGRPSALGLWPIVQGWPPPVRLGLIRQSARGRLFARVLPTRQTSRRTTCHLGPQVAPTAPTGFGAG